MGAVYQGNLLKHNESIDTNFVLDDGATGAYTADDVLNVGGSAASIDWGTNSVTYPMVMANIGVTAIDFTTTDEVYNFLVEQATDSGFTAIVATDTLDVPGTTPDDSIAKLNVQVVARYMRISLDVTGTTPSITVTRAWISENE